MASATSLFPLTFKNSLPSSLPLNPLSLSSVSSSFSFSSSSSTSSRVSAHVCSKGISFNGSDSYPCSLSEKTRSLCPSRLICRASEYEFPDPIPEFADAETEKFRVNLVEKLSKKKDLYKDEDTLTEVVEICTEIFSTFVHSEYGGPGTLLVIPFMDMSYAIIERGLPGGPQAARAAVKWAQDHVDKDWKEWTKGN